MSPCEMWSVPGSPDEWFSRQTTCIPGRINCDLVCDSVGVLAPALAAEPDCEDVPTPELRDKTSMCEESERKEKR